MKENHFKDEFMSDTKGKFSSLKERFRSDFSKPPEAHDVKRIFPVIKFLIVAS